MENSYIKLRVNHNVNFNFEDTKIKNLLIIGNTINFFGFFNDEDIDYMSMHENDRNHYEWLLKRCIEKTNIYIIGESEEHEYYTNVFNYFGSLGIKVNWKFKETKEPKEYLEKLSLLEDMKFDYIIGNPPFGTREHTNLDVKCLNHIINNGNKIIWIMPFAINSNNSDRKKLYSSSNNIKKITLVDPKSFNISVFIKYLGIFELDNNKQYSHISIIDLNNNESMIENTKEGRYICYVNTLFNRNFVNVVNKTTNVYKDLHNKYKRMIDDTEYFIYEENQVFRNKTGKKGQSKLERVKKYLKEGTYKYCLYKGSFNNSYNEVQEWLNTEDTDKIFNGQICWLCNNVNVRNNIKYWMESPLFDMWRKYYFGDTKPANCCIYGLLPALPFDMDENTFKTFVNNLYIFTEEDKKILREMNIHNIDNDEYYK